MKTSNLLLTSASLLIGAAVVAQVVLTKVSTPDPVALAGQRTTRSYDMPALKHLDFHGPIRLILSSGMPSIAIEADEALHDQLVDLNDDPEIYEMRVNSSGLSWGKEQLVTARISSPHIDRVSLSGNGSVESASPLTWRSLELALSGSPTARLTVVDMTSLHVSGSGSIQAEVEGVARALVIDGAGSVSVDAAQLQARTVEAELSGSCEVRVHADSTLRVDARGSNTVLYSGQPRITSQMSGSSELRSL